MKLKLFNTQSRVCEDICETDKKTLGIYCCGPTVYGPAHVGNFRTYVVQDLVLRILKLLNIRFIYVRNLTDVDDKTIRGAQMQHQTLSDYTQHWAEVFERDCKSLNLIPPTFEPKATETIAEQQELIATLIHKGYAYTRGGSVYFRIAAFKSYGKLSHLAERSLQTQELNSAGISNDADEYDREHIADFALWKAHKPEDGDVFWDSPWGKGRPGWHIECSAMAHMYLGNTVDLHAGGVDLCFPHHENEIAQSEAAYGAPFVRHWLHIAHLKVEGQKMSKSLGNLLTLDMLQEKAYSPDVVRYALSTGHYRQPLNFTFDLLNASQCALQRINNYVLTLLTETHTSLSDFNASISTAILPQRCIFLQSFFESMLNDLNIPKALGCLFSFINEKRSLSMNDKQQLLCEFAACLYALGINIKPFNDVAKIEAPEDIQRLAEQRWLAKQSRNFQEADRLRQILAQAGWKVTDTKDGYALSSSK